MKRRSLVFLSGILLALILLGFTLYSNGFGIALKIAGFSKDFVQYVDWGINENGNEYRVLFQYMPGYLIKMAHLEKGMFGIWKVLEEASGPQEQSESVTIGWMRIAGLIRYGYGLESQIKAEFEVHHMIGGNNAIRVIELPKELLPPNVIAKVFQKGRSYVVHLVSYGEDAGILNEVHLVELLEQQGCIRKGAA